jgi:hypothetical protein
MTLKLVPSKRAFNSREAAHYIGKSGSWLAKKRLRGVEDPGDPGPRFRKSTTGQAIYLIEDLDQYLDSLEVGIEQGSHPRAA